MSLSDAPRQPLVVTHVRLHYPLPGQRFLQVLDIPSFRLAAGSIVAITGPSGCGKTSLLHTLCGLRAPDAGTVRWGTTEITCLSESARDAWRRRMVGLIFQDFHLFPGMSALQNVLLPASFTFFRVPSWLRQRARHLLAAVDIHNMEEVAATMSRGEMQRVAVARALLFAPPIVLADEPTASLDMETGAQVHALLLKMCRGSHSTLIMVTHDPMLARHAEIHYQLQRGVLVASQSGEASPPERAPQC